MSYFFRKLTKVVMFLLLLVIVFTGCADDEEQIIEQEYDATIVAEIYAPVSTEKTYEQFGFEVFLYKAYVGDPVYKTRMNGKSVYTVGEDAFLEGSNVEQLDGAVIEVSHMSYEELYVNDNHKSSNVFGLEISLSYRGAINEDVLVEAVKIPELGIDYAVDYLHIKTIEIPDSVEICFEEDAEKPINLKVWGIGGSPYNSEWYACDTSPEKEESFVTGTVNDADVVLEVEALPEWLYVEPQTDNNLFSKNDEILIRYDYWFDNEYSEQYDSVGGSVILKVKSENGEFWYFDTLGMSVTDAHLPTKLFVN